MIQGTGEESRLFTKKCRCPRKGAGRDMKKRTGSPQGSPNKARCLPRLPSQERQEEGSWGWVEP